jgi:hypothetical protein
MRDQEIVGLWEAYASVYTQPQELTEEVEIAAQYFYEMGLNEDGVEILIEDIGVEEFANFVYDIAENYCLTEARAGGVKIEPKLASGKEIVGKPKAASLKRLRAQKEVRREAEQSASEAKPSGMKASLQRQSAVAAAANKQPKKPGLLDRVASAVTKGIKRHNSAMGELKKMGAATAVTAGKVKKAAGEFKKGLTSEEFDQLDENRMASRMEKMPSAPAKVGKATHSIKDLVPSKAPSPKEKAKARKALGLDEAGTATGPRLTDAYDKPPYGDDLKSKPTKKGPKMKGVVRKEEVDLYDIILSHLLDEGYADTEKAAEAIMVNMSEDWRESIVEEVLDEDANYDRNRRRAAQRAAERNAARAAGKTGVVPGVGYVSPRRESETYRDSAGVERHKSGAKNA